MGAETKVNDHLAFLLEQAGLVEGRLTRYIAPSAPLMTPEPEATGPGVELEADLAPPAAVWTRDEASETPSIAESSKGGLLNDMAEVRG